MLIVTGTFRIPTHNIDAGRPHMAAMIAASRAEAGCVHGADLLDPGLIHVTEHWIDRAALEAPSSKRSCVPTNNCRAGRL